MTNEIVTIRPPELTFFFELKKQSSCHLQLVNNMNFDVAFKVLATSTYKYCVQPETGVLPPQSTWDVTVTMNAQPEAPQDMQCKDKFFVQSCQVPAGTTAKDIPPEMFSKKSAQFKELRVVYVSPVQTTSPEPQSLEDESAAKDFVDNWSQVIDAKDKKDARFYNAVVKVYCTHAEPDYFSPWLKKRPYPSTSSAFMICGRKLLTNAHCVEHHTQVKVQRKGDDTKYVATVLAKGVECDIALLSVESEGFWKGTEPLRFGRLPCLQDAVTVVGYPQGGDSISVTKGVVSRIEVISYVHGAADLLGIQIDAAINYGNSGGPVFNDSGECIGIAFQVVRSAGAENIGYVIPITVVSHFLNDYDRNGEYTGFPSLGVSLQKLENPALRARLKVTVNEGVLIREIEPTSLTKKVLRKGDVILSFDGVPVAKNGTVPFGSTERIAFEHLISEKFTGDAAKLEIIRKRKKMNVVTTLKPPVYLVPYHIEGGQPSYLIVAGLVFTILSEPLIKDEREESKRTKLMAKARYTLPKFEGEQMVTEAQYSLPKFEGEQMVILSQVLDSDINIGYENIRNQQVLKLNGIKIKNIRHLAYLVDSCNDHFLTFMLEHNFLVVMEREAALAATPQILKVYGIACEMSPDLLELCKNF